MMRVQVLFPVAAPCVAIVGGAKGVVSMKIVVTVDRICTKILGSCERRGDNRCSDCGAVCSDCGRCERCREHEDCRACSSDTCTGLLSSCEECGRDNCQGCTRAFSHECMPCNTCCDQSKLTLFNVWAQKERDHERAIYRCNRPVGVRTQLFHWQIPNTT